MIKTIKETKERFHQIVKDSNVPGAFVGRYNHRMVRRRAAHAGFTQKLVFRATGITAYLEGGGPLENAQATATHERRNRAR